jgi:hypothetical protein
MLPTSLDRFDVRWLQPLALINDHRCNYSFTTSSILFVLNSRHQSSTMKTGCNNVVRKRLNAHIVHMLSTILFSLVTPDQCRLMRYSWANLGKNKRSLLMKNYLGNIFPSHQQLETYRSCLDIFSTPK